MPFPHKELKLASVGNPPTCAQKLPSPTTVVMMPSGPTRRIRWLLWSTMYKLPSGPTASPPPANASESFAAVAGPLSPEKPAVPVPATVLTIPDGSIFRMRCTSMK